MVTESATAAVKKLFITQPAVSRLIVDLEYKVKFKLSMRRYNRLKATPQAQLFYRNVNRTFLVLKKSALCRSYCQ
jgi:DNA-binding transcriptional LysR family regulator